MSEPERIITIIGSIPQPWQRMIVMLMEERDKARANLEQARETNRRFQRRIQLLEGWWQRRVERANQARDTYFALMIAGKKDCALNPWSIEEAAYQRGYADGHDARITIPTKRGEG